MPTKAVMLALYQHSVDPADVNNAIAYVTFRFLGAGQDLGTLDTTVTILPSDTAATVVSKIEAAVIARAAEYGVTLAAADIIPRSYGEPQALMSTTSSATVTLSDDGTNLDVYGSLGILRFSASATTGPRLSLDPGGNQVQIEYRPSGNLVDFTEGNAFGTGDLSMLAFPTNGTGYMALQAVNSAGMILATNTAVPISVRPNTMEVARFDATGLTMPAGVQFKNVARQAYTITNHSDDRSYNETSTTLTEIAHVLGTLIGDLRAIGAVA